MKNLIIVYEDSNILVLNKPAGLLVHKINLKDSRQTLVDLVLEKYPEIKRPRAEIEHGFAMKSQIDLWNLRPGIVHRLDKETSGLIMVAKNQKALGYFQNLFQERKVKKTYLALVHGHLKDKKGKIDAPLGKIGAKQTTRLEGKKELTERSAMTDYEVVQEFPNYSLLQVYPQTGRTHQIRIHLKSIGHPIVCDKIYGGKKMVCPPKLGRLFLHAQRIELKNLDGQNLVLEADPPEELTNFLKSSNIS